MVFRRFSPQTGLFEADRIALWTGMLVLSAGKGEERMEGAELDQTAGSRPGPCGFSLRIYRHRVGS